MARGVTHTGSKCYLDRNAVLALDQGRGLGDQMMRERYSYRDDPSVPAFPDDRPIIIFDGKCVLCSVFAQFILREDRGGYFRLLAAQSTLGTALYKHYNLNPFDYETNLLLERGEIFAKSEGSIRMFEGLGFPWSLARLGRLIPRSLRDPLYDVIARNRLRWFGVRQTCFMPDAQHAERFLA
jgi:predicted DCC family thiol-disulfide oxidoreductase YuxK